MQPSSLADAKQSSSMSADVKSPPEDSTFGRLFHQLAALVAAFLLVLAVSK